jgi:hypothetical protein
MIVADIPTAQTSLALTAKTEAKVLVLGGVRICRHLIPSQ